MDRLDPAAIATILLTETAGWARWGITAPDARLRERAADELALTIVEQLDDTTCHDPRQLAFPL